MPLALNRNERSQPLRLSLWRPHYRRTLEGELPIFLNLLRVTTEAGFNLPQSIKCLSHSSETECPHLVKTFNTILERAYATDTALCDALLEASQRAKIDFVANLMTALAVQNVTTVELLSILRTQTEIANSLPEDRVISLRKNYWRRWTPHVLFYIIFASPLMVVTMLGPALQPAPVWAIGPGVLERNFIIDTRN